MKTKKLLIISVIALVLAVACVVGTVALLMRETNTIVNVFTIGNVDIMLDETKGTEMPDGERSFKMIPGQTIDKDPVLTVKKGSEDCYVFVKIEEKNNQTVRTGEGVTNISLISYSPDTSADWKVLENHNLDNTTVYYKKVQATDITDDDGLKLNVFKDNKVTVNADLTVDDMTAASAGEKAPKLSLTGYAVQAAGITSETEAWTKIAETYLASSES